MKLLFLGQISKNEFGLSFCNAWEREVGPLMHVPFKKHCRDMSPDSALEEVLDLIGKEKPSLVCLWHGHQVNRFRSKRLRDACEKHGAQFVYLTLDDPFAFIEMNHEAGHFAHKVVTCCAEMLSKYKALGAEPIFAPPACSIDEHIRPVEAIEAEENKLKEEVFYFFTNPYMRPVFQKYGAFNRLETIRRLLEKGIQVSIAATERVFQNDYLSKAEWAKINKIGHIAYRDFYKYSVAALFFNSNVVGRDFIYFNQRVFEILGIGGVQLIDSSPKFEQFFEFFLKENGIKPVDSPFLFYHSIREFAEVTEKALADKAGLLRRRKAARKLRHAWTFEKLVRRIAFNEKTVFDRFLAQRKS